MSRKHDLETHILTSYGIVLEYETTNRDTDRPEERNRAIRNIAKQWDLIRSHVDEYIVLCQRLNVNMRNDVVEIAVHFPEYTHLLSQRKSGESDIDVSKARSPNSTPGRNIESHKYDVFLCHNSCDKEEVKEIGEQLKNRGLAPWLDEWDLPPGRLWLKHIEEQIADIKAAAVFIGTQGLGPWQKPEIYAFLLQFNERGCPVIPVLLPSLQGQPELPVFLKGLNWVDFREQHPNPIEKLIWGITGTHDSNEA